METIDVETINEVLRNMVKDALENSDSKVEINEKDQFIYNRMNRTEQDAVLAEAVSNIGSIRYDVGNAVETVVKASLESNTE